jgi:hypothetical protein
MCRSAETVIQASLSCASALDATTPTRRHIITVELLKLRYDLINQDKQNFFLRTIRQLLDRNETKQKALAYLAEWGSNFWQETEYRTKEFTRKLETDLSANAKLDAKYIQLGS